MAAENDSSLSRWTSLLFPRQSHPNAYNPLSLALTPPHHSGWLVAFRVTSQLDSQPSWSHLAFPTQQETLIALVRDPVPQDVDVPGAPTLAVHTRPVIVRGVAIGEEAAPP